MEDIARNAVAQLVALIGPLNLIAVVLPTGPPGKCGYGDHSRGAAVG